MAEGQKLEPKKNTRKVGRNDPCTCGSGLKFKKCCFLKKEPTGQRMMASKDGRVWGEVPPQLRAKARRFFEEKQRKEQERVARFGQVRPQMSSIVWEGDRIVAV